MISTPRRLYRFILEYFLFLFSIFLLILKRSFFVRAGKRGSKLVTKASFFIIHWLKLIEFS